MKQVCAYKNAQKNIARVQNWPDITIVELIRMVNGDDDDDEYQPDTHSYLCADCK